MMPTPPAPLPRLRAAAPLIGILGLCVLTELVLLGADFGLWGSQRWRPLSYQYGAFWAGLLHGWRPNYAAQPVLMFVSYAFLHAGPGHLIGNMLGLFGLGRIAARRLGAGGFLGLYLASALGGGAAFGLLSRSPSPMVGASGAIFGLAAAWVVWEWQDRRQAGARGWAAAAPAIWITLALAGFNLAMWLFLSGMLAWQTHLGGFVAGAGFAALWAAYAPRLAKIRS